MKTTTLDYAILGLLLESPRTAYAIRKAFEETALGNFSSSPGTIYPATKRLKQLKLISNKKDGAGNILLITDKGRSKMKVWLSQPITSKEIEKQSTLLILKFAFMDHLVSQPIKVNFLRSMIDLTDTYIKTLEQYEKSYAKTLPLHGKLAFEYGVKQFKTQLTWAKSALKKIEQ